MYTSIVNLMWTHASNFYRSCRRFIFVSCSYCTWLYTNHTIIILTSLVVISLLAFFHLSVSFIAHLYVRMYVCMYAVFSSAWRSRVDGGLELCSPQVMMAQCGQTGRRNGWKTTRHLLPGGWVVWWAVIELEPDHLSWIDVMQIFTFSLEPPPTRTISTLPTPCCQCSPFFLFVCVL